MLTWWQFWEMYKGYNRRRSMEFEHTRFLAWTINATSISPIKAWKKPEDVMPLAEIDNHQRHKQNSTTLAEIEEMRERISRELGREIQIYKTPKATA